jgi:ferredoxin
VRDERPGVFVLSDEDRHAQVRDAEVPPGFEAAVRAAADSCPERAVVTED